MMLRSHRHPIARPTSRGSFRSENRAEAAPHTHDHFAVPSSHLRDHLLRDHGRSAREIDGLSLTDLHRFEHVEQAMGLNDLSHQHAAVVGRAGSSAGIHH
jgi:hypothetical protein